jgi:hypothetical protein
MDYRTGAALARTPATTASRSHLFFLVLYLLDAFMLGGLVALLAVSQLLESIKNRVVTMEAASEILNVQDQLLPYYVAFIGAFLALALLTLGAWLWRALRSPRRS